MGAARPRSAPQACSRCSRPTGRVLRRRRALAVPRPTGRVLRRGRALAGSRATRRVPRRGRALAGSRATRRVVRRGRGLAVLGAPPPRSAPGRVLSLTWAACVLRPRRALAGARAAGRVLCGGRGFSCASAPGSARTPWRRRVRRGRRPGRRGRGSIPCDDMQRLMPPIGSFAPCGGAPSSPRLPSAPKIPQSSPEPDFVVRRPGGSLLPKWGTSRRFHRFSICHSYVFRRFRLCNDDPGHSIRHGAGHENRRR